MLPGNQFTRQMSLDRVLGLDLLEHFLDEDLPIPVAFQMPDLAESVR